MITILFNLIGQETESLIKINRYISHKSDTKTSSRQVTDIMACLMKEFNEGE